MNYRPAHPSPIWNLDKSSYKSKIYYFSPIYFILSGIDRLMSILISESMSKISLIRIRFAKGSFTISKQKFCEINSIVTYYGTAVIYVQKNYFKNFVKVTFY